LFFLCQRGENQDIGARGGKKKNEALFVKRKKTSFVFRKDCWLKRANYGEKRGGGLVKTPEEFSTETQGGLIYLSLINRGTA